MTAPSRPAESENEIVVLPFQAGKTLADIDLLSKSSFLSRLGMRDLGVFLDALDQLVLPAGTTIYEQGQEGEHMYFVLDGQARSRRGSMDVARLGPGDHFGELAILGIRPRTTTVSSESVVRLARLSRSRFMSIAANHPRVALHVTEALAASLAAIVTSMTDDVGLLLQQRTLPRRSIVRAMVSSNIMDLGMGALVGGLFPRTIDGALVVAATIDRKPVSLDTPVTSDARIEPLTVANWEGRRIYRSSVALLMLEAARQIFVATSDDGIVLSLGPRRGEGQIVEVRGKLSTETIPAIEQRMRDLVAAATPLREELWAVEEARARFTEQGWHDAATLLPFHRDKTISLLSCGGTFALGLGPVLSNARELRGFALSSLEGVGEEVGGVGTGVVQQRLLLEFGEALRPHTAASSIVVTSAVGRMVPGSTSHDAANAHANANANVMAFELSAWLHALGVTSVGRFNRSCVAGQVGELIRVSEGFHEKHIGRIADRIVSSHARVVGIAGPSSSGKTTFIKRLKVQLEVNGVTPVHLSLDDYYVDRERTPKDETGDYDFEAAEAIDTALFDTHASHLLRGERVRTARYDFKSGKSLPVGGPELTLSPSSVLLVEGLHALNPTILAKCSEAARAFRVFVHPATALPFDRLTTVLPEDIRLVRRIVRDRHQRGYLASETLRRWPSVRRGEERHVFTTLAQADVVFDTSLVYELAVFRVYAERYLLEIAEDDPTYPTSYRLRQLLDRFVPIHPDHVPPTSILREFIGGSGFDL